MKELATCDMSKDELWAILGELFQYSYVYLVDVERWPMLDSSGEMSLESTTVSRCSWENGNSKNMDFGNGRPNYITELTTSDTYQDCCIVYTEELTLDIVPAKHFRKYKDLPNSCSHGSIVKEWYEPVREGDVLMYVIDYKNRHTTRDVKTNNVLTTSLVAIGQIYSVNKRDVRWIKDNKRGWECENSPQGVLLGEDGLPC